jgi:hypothetical protein
MGTRNLTMVIADGKTKIAQYGQWDGYPSGQGATVLNFLNKANLMEFKKKLKQARFIDTKKQKEIDAFLKSIGAENGWMNMEQSAQYHAKYPLLTRDNGAAVLNMIMELPEGEKFWLHDSSDFAGDGLFCEWAYVVDLDKRTFEVYKGFYKEPLAESERFAHLKGEGEYSPVKLVKSYTFSDMPETEAEFLAHFEQVMSEEE